jgi:hypothetical protein
MACKTVELTDEQITRIMSVLKEKIEDLDVVLKNSDSDGLSMETIRDLSIERRDINSIVTELQFYVIMQ